LDKTITSEKYISTFQRWPDSIYDDYDRVETVDWDIAVSRQVQNQLPKGVFIQKQSPSILYDGRDYRISFPSTRQETSSCVPIPTKHSYLKHVRRWKEYDGNIDTYEIDGRKTPYIEGCRVYLTVSEEYASRIFDEVCNSRYPFRNYLLEEYDQILKDIALKWSCWGYHPHCEGQIFIEFYGVRIRGAYEGDGAYDWDSISYEKFGMANLKTYEQQQFRERR
jgi:hypothetical protein